MLYKRFLIMSMLKPYLSILGLFFLAAPAPLVAQEPGEPATAEEAAETGDSVPATETVEEEGAQEIFVDVVNVNVVNVDVYVTDKRGNRITGLTRDDFELYEDGRPMPITNFAVVEDGRPVGEEEEQPAEPEAEPTPRLPFDGEAAPVPDDQRLFLVVYLDNFNIRPMNRNRVMGDLRRFLLERLDPEDRVMLVSYDRSLNVRQPFTGDARLVAMATLELEKVTGFAVSRDSERRQALDEIEDSQSSFEALNHARSYAASVENDLTFSLNALKEIVGSLAGLPGRKAVLYVSDGIPMVAGEDLFHAVDQKFPGQTGSLLESFSYDFSRRFRELAAQANANRITFYTLDAQGLQVGAGISAEERGPGLGAFVESVRRHNLQNPLRYLADTTGGIAIVNTNAVFPGLERIADDFDTYYSLGYTPSHYGDGRYYKIEVKLKDKRRGVVIRHREGYRDLSTETRMNEGTLAALYHAVERNTMDVILDFDGGERRDDGFYLVPIRVIIPIGKLTLVPSESTYEGRVRIFVAAMDDQGGTSPVQQVPVTLSIPQEEIETAQGKRYAYELTLLMRPGEQRIAVGVRDDIAAETAFVSRRIFLKKG